MARWWNGRHTRFRAWSSLGREGSSLSLVTDSFRGRLMVGPRALNPLTLVRSQPPELVCKWPRGVPVARDPAKVEGEVRLLTGILQVGSVHGWPGPRRGLRL